MTQKVPGITSLFVEFSYNEDIIAELKSMPCFNYSKKNNKWEIPINYLSLLIDKLCIYDDIDLRLCNVIFEEDKELLPQIPLVEQNSEILLKRLYECGAVDNFYPYDPAYKKYLLKNSIKKLIINCSEVDPYVACESSLFETYLSEVVEGAKGPQASNVTKN